MLIVIATSTVSDYLLHEKIDDSQSKIGAMVNEVLTNMDKHGALRHSHGRRPPSQKDLSFHCIFAILVCDEQQA